MTRVESLPDLRPGVHSRRVARPDEDWRNSKAVLEILAALALFSLALVNLFGAIGVLVFMALSACILAMQPLASFAFVLRYAWLLPLPVLAMMSTIWSDSPQRSMRGGIQLAMTFIAAILIAKNLRPSKFILTLQVAFLVIALTVLPDVPQAVAANLPLSNPVLGSKNQVGFVGFMLFCFSAAVLIDSDQSVWARIATVAALPTALLLLVLAQSAGSVTSLLLMMAIFPPLAMLLPIPLRFRIGLAVVLLVALVITSFFIADLQLAADDFRANVLKKDATLTGRTYLWQVASRLIAERPNLGYGYGAFWRPGNIDAEGLWRWGGIANRTGFNFHNVLIGIRIDLGLVGMAILVVDALAIALVALIRQIMVPSIPIAFLLSMTITNYFRSYFEEGLIAPFSLITVICLVTAVYALARRSVVELPLPTVKADRPSQSNRKGTKLRSDELSQSGRT